MVVWSDIARDQIDAIYEFIASSSPAYARGVVDRIFRRGEDIARFPLAGRLMPELGLKQIREVIEGPYRIIYHIGPDQIEVIAVFHGAQETPWTKPSSN